MVFYPLSSLMLSGIRNILIISTQEDLPSYRKILGDGADLGLDFCYEVQLSPAGIAQALIIGRDFVGSNSVTLILGDNIFYGQGLSHLFQTAIRANDGATVFGYPVKDPQRYGVAEFDDKGNLSAIVEKPSCPKSNCAVTGLYIYDSEVIEIARALKPSSRGELEISDVNNEYLRRGRLKLIRLGRGVSWLDTGTPDALLETSQYFAAIEHRQGLKVACLEEVAYRMGYIDSQQVRRLANRYNGDFRDYLESIASEPQTGDMS